MPAAIAIPLITAAVTGGAAVTSGVMQSKANKRATDAQSKSTAEALAFERDNELRRRQEYDRSEAESRAQFDAEQARKAPFREMADVILRRRAERLGIPFSPRSAALQSGMPAQQQPAPRLSSLTGTQQSGMPPNPQGLSLGDLARQTAQQMKLRERYPQQA